VNHRTFFSIFCALALALSVSAANKPNIIIIVADDLGYADLGCQGSKDVRTPFIDSIAANGIRYTDGYVSCPVISPTRAGMKTGRYKQRFGHELNPPPPSQAGNTGLSLKEKTLADRLKAAGYTTGMFGKWHLGLAEMFNPTHRGFDEYFGFLHGRHDYLDWEADPFNPIVRGTHRAKPVKGETFLTDAFTREAVSFIDRHQKEPFFIYLPYNAVHSPLEVPKYYRDRFSGVRNVKRRTYLAMLSAMDDGVGAVLHKLYETGLATNTLVIFFSDNGGPTEETTSSNKPLSRGKGSVHEGGIRTPAMMQWPGTLPEGKVYTQPVIQLDYHTTALAAGGALANVTTNLDGVDLLPYLTGKKTGAPHEYLYWRYGKQWAIRSGNYKLGQFTNGSKKLFDLSTDIAERNDLSKEKPEIVAKLQHEWDAWNSQLQPPSWRRNDKNKPPAIIAPLEPARKEDSGRTLRNVANPNFNQ
jgi:arylsulfatase A-like enzyme